MGQRLTWEGECRGQETPELLSTWAFGPPVENVLRSMLLNEAMIFLALALVLQYYVLLFCPKRLCISARRYGVSEAFRLIGRNVIILQLYYAPWIWELFGVPASNRHPFCCSLLLVAFDACGFSYFVRGLSWLLQGCRRGGCFTREQLAKAKKDDAVKNKYQHLASPLLAVFALFMAQVSLFALMVTFINHDPDTHDTCKVVLLEWVVAVIVTHVAGSDESGSAHDGAVWSQMLKDMQKSGQYEGHKVEYWARRAADLIINTFCREVLFGVAPIVLCASGPMDFVKDALAIFFIVRLDDLNDAKSITETLKGLKARDNLFAGVNKDGFKVESDSDDGASFFLVV